MEFQDLANVKHIKVIATTGVATVAVATSTSPVMAQPNNYSSQNQQTTYTTQTIQDCPPGQPKPTPTPIPVPIPKPIPTPTPVPIPVPVPKPTPKPVPTPIPVPTPVTSTPVPKPAPVAITTAAPVTPTKELPAPVAPTALPNTGAGDVIAPVAGIGALGYIGNIFRLRRKANRE